MYACTNACMYAYTRTYVYIYICMFAQMLACVHVCELIFPLSRLARPDARRTRREKKEAPATVAPQIEKALEDQEVDDGGVATLECTFTGESPHLSAHLLMSHHA